MKNLSPFNNGILNAAVLNSACPCAVSEALRHGGLLLHATLPFLKAEVCHGLQTGVTCAKLLESFSLYTAALFSIRTAANQELA